MIKILLVLFTLITLFLGFRIANILVNDLDRLTDFGYGYLVAQVILFCIFLFASLWLGRRILKQSRAGEHTRSS
jgi:membrane protein implicated in regulation of membrane protease activity